MYLTQKLRWANDEYVAIINNTWIETVRTNFYPKTRLSGEREWFIIFRVELHHLYIGVEKHRNRIYT